MSVLRTMSFSLGAIVALGLTAPQAAAADFGSSQIETIDRAIAPIGVWDKDAANVERHRRYRGRYDRGRHYRGRHYRDRGIDAGDVLAGVLILGGIAAVIDAASDDDRDDRYRDPRYRNDARYDRETTGGLERAAEICRAAIERDRRVEDVDDVRRTGVGWSVSGTLYDGQGFQCYLDNRGDISQITYGDGFAQTEDRQWDDARYRAARLQVEQGGPDNAPYANDEYRDGDEALPAYPGGPVNGEVVYAEGDYGG